MLVHLHGNMKWNITVTHMYNAGYVHYLGYMEQNWPIIGRVISWTFYQHSEMKLPKKVRFTLMIPAIAANKIWHCFCAERRFFCYSTNLSLTTACLFNSCESTNKIVLYKLLNVLSLRSIQKVSNRIAGIAENNTISFSQTSLTLGGPTIIPVQWVKLISSSFSKPQLTVPSPPFCPSSSSSSRRKLRGTTVKIK